MPGRLVDKGPELRSPQVVERLDLHPPHHLPGSLEQVRRVVELRSVVEAEADPLLGQGEITELLRHLLRARSVARGLLMGPHHLDRLREDVEDQVPGTASQPLGLGWPMGDDLLELLGMPPAIHAPRSPDQADRCRDFPSTSRNSGDSMLAAASP